MNEDYIKYGGIFVVVLIIVGAIILFMSPKQTENINKVEIPKPTEINPINTPSNITDQNTNKNSNKDNMVNNSQIKTNETSEIEITAKDLPAPIEIDTFDFDVNLSIPAENPQNNTENITDLPLNETIPTITLPDNI